MQQLGPLTYLIDISDGRLWKRHVDHLKQCSAQAPLVESETGETGPQEAQETGGEEAPPHAPMETPAPSPLSVPETVAPQPAAQLETRGDLVSESATSSRMDPVAPQVAVPAVPVESPLVSTPGRNSVRSRSTPPVQSRQEHVTISRPRVAHKQPPVLKVYPTRQRSKPDWFHDKPW